MRKGSSPAGNAHPCQDRQMKAITRILLSMTLVAIAPLIASAQEVNRSKQGPTFEVASVRPNTSGDGGGGINIQPGGRVTALNVPLLWLIESAYGPGIIN